MWKSRAQKHSWSPVICPSQSNSASDAKFLPWQWADKNNWAICAPWIQRKPQGSLDSPISNLTDYMLFGKLHRVWNFMPSWYLVMLILSLKIFKIFPLPKVRNPWSFLHFPLSFSYQIWNKSYKRKLVKDFAVHQLNRSIDSHSNN